MALKYCISNRRDLQNVKEGDLIEFPRGTYSHWAVYAGNEEIIHVAATDGEHIQSNSVHIILCTLCGVNFDKAVVRKDTFSKVAEGKPAYVNNTLDEKISPRRKTEILKEALSKIGQKGYNLLLNNCEHFATCCRYGKERSEQVRTFVKYAVGGAVVGGLLAGMYGGANQKE